MRISKKGGGNFFLLPGAGQLEIGLRAEFVLRNPLSYLETGFGKCIAGRLSSLAR
jgi:hypothetical protein